MSTVEQWAGVDLRRLPIQEGVERALLGALLIDRHAIKQVADKVRPGDFLIVKHRVIYGAMLHVHYSGKATDLVTVTDALGPEGLAEVDLGYLARLGMSPPSSTGVYDYAEMVAEQGRKKTLAEGMNRALATLIDFPHMNAGEVAAILTGTVEAIERGRDNDEKEHLVTASLSSLLERQFPPMQWIIPDILPVGATILGGKAKMGKTYFALGVALAASLGGVALGHKRVGRTNVLYMALEDGEEILQERCKELLAGHPPPREFHYCTASPTMDHDGIDILNEWLDNHPGTEFVVVDTLKRVRPRQNMRKNAYDEDYDALSGFADLAHRRRLSILILHHLNKNPAVEDPFDELSGSMGIQAVPDTLMVLRGIRGQADAILHVIGRRMKEQQDLALKRDPVCGLWELMGDAENYGLQKARQEIVDAIDDFGAPMSPSVIAATLDKNPNTTRVLLAKMVRDGQLPPPHGGRYSTNAKTDVNVNAPAPATSKILDFWRQDAENQADPDDETTVYATNGINSDIWRNDAKNGQSVYVYGDLDETEGESF